jgi:hypothetical protein
LRGTGGPAARGRRRPTCARAVPPRSGAPPRCPRSGRRWRKPVAMKQSEWLRPM